MFIGDSSKIYWPHRIARVQSLCRLLTCLTNFLINKPALCLPQSAILNPKSEIVNGSSFFWNTSASWSCNVPRGGHYSWQTPNSEEPDPRVPEQTQ
jgi:hypothetical protein